MALEDLLSLFALRPPEVFVYEKVLEQGPLKAGDLARHTNLNRTSIYDIIERLIQAGLIYESLKGGVKLFASQSPEKIGLLIEEKEKNIIAAKNAVIALRSTYINSKSSFTPRLQVFEGQQELQQMMKDLLLYNNMTVYSYWAVEKVIESLGPKFVEEYHKTRVKNNITLQTIWPRKHNLSLKKYPFLETGRRYKREIRIAPPNVEFSLGYSVYSNTIRFLSSNKENFGFLIDSSELAETMRGQFQIIWNMSKPFKFKI